MSGESVVGMTGYRALEKFIQASRPDDDVTIGKLLDYFSSYGVPEDDELYAYALSNGSEFMDEPIPLHVIKSIFEKMELSMSEELDDEGLYLDAADGEVAAGRETRSLANLSLPGVRSGILKDRLSAGYGRFKSVQPTSILASLDDAIERVDRCARDLSMENDDKLLEGMAGEADRALDYLRSVLNRAGRSVSAEWSGEPLDRLRDCFERAKKAVDMAIGIEFAKASMKARDVMDIIDRLMDRIFSAGVRGAENRAGV